MIRIIMVVCVKLVGQALPRAWAVGTARKMAYTVRLECCLGDGGGGGVAVSARGCLSRRAFAGTTWEIDGEYVHVSTDGNLWEKLVVGHNRGDCLSLSCGEDVVRGH